MLVNLSWMATLKKHLSAICKQGQQLRFPHRTHAGKMAGLGVDWEECYCCRRNPRGGGKMQNKRMGLKWEAARDIPQQGKHLVFITLQYFHDLTTFRFVKSRQCNRVLPWKKIIGGSRGRVTWVTWVTLRLKNLVTDVILVWDALVVPGPGLERPPLIWASFIHRRSGQIFLIASIRGRMPPRKRMHFGKVPNGLWPHAPPKFFNVFLSSCSKSPV